MRRKDDGLDNEACFLQSCVNRVRTASNAIIPGASRVSRSTLLPKLLKVLAELLLLRVSRLVAHGPGEVLRSLLARSDGTTWAQQAAENTNSASLG